MNRPTRGEWINKDGLVNGHESRERFAPSPSIDIFDASDWPAELHEEALANARLIAAAGTVANQLYDEGFNGIEAVKALPELYHTLVNCSAALSYCLILMPSNDPLFNKGSATETAAANLLARLKGDAE